MCLSTRPPLIQDSIGHAERLDLFVTREPFSGRHNTLIRSIRIQGLMQQRVSPELEAENAQGLCICAASLEHMGRSVLA